VAVISLDTNLLVRYFVADDPGQHARAVALLRSERVFVPKTVLLEAEWILRGTYKYSRAAIISALRALLGLRSLEVEDRGSVAHAVRWFESGLDFADALHLASSAKATAFATFDRQLRHRATALACDPAVIAP
jgi:predicted nucleic-acid-binding protein